MDELSLLCRRFGWQGGTIHDARREAKKRGWRSFTVHVHIVPPVLEVELGKKVVELVVRVWGVSKQEALRASGIG